MKLVCNRCNAIVGGGNGGLHVHQKSRRCKVMATQHEARTSSKVSSRKRRFSLIYPITSGVLPTEAEEIVLEPNHEEFEDCPLPDIPDEPPPDEELPVPPDRHEFVDDGPLQRAASRFAAIRDANRNRVQRQVVGENGDKLGDKDLIVEAIPTKATEATSSEETVMAGYKDILSCLIGLIAPPDHKGCGLSRSDRTKVFALVDACLRLRPCSEDGLPPLRILDLLQVLSPRETTSVNEDRLLMAYMDDLCSDDGWVEREVSVRSGHSATGRWNEKITDSLVDVVCDNWDHVQRRCLYDGETFSHPTTGIHMYEFENIVRKQQRVRRRWDPDRDFVLLLVFFSDGTLLANKGSLTAHPVTISVANLPSKLCASSQILLGYIGEFSNTSFVSGTRKKSAPLKQKQQADVRRALMAAQTKAMVEPLVLASYEGIEFNDPTGTPRRMFPTLFSAPLDHPEVCSHLGHKSTYCGICYWKAGLTHAMWRREEKSRKLVDDIAQAPRSRIQDLKNVHGAHGQPSGLWGFNGSCPVEYLPRGLTPETREAVELAGSVSPWTDIHVAVSGEVMHEIDLGVLIYSKIAILRHMKDVLCMSDVQIEAVNEGLRLSMTTESRVQGLSHPPTKKITGQLQGYFGGSSRIEAKEHRAVLQFMVPVLVRFLGKNDTATRLAALVVKYYKSRQRHVCLPVGENGHTEETLDQVSVLFEKVQAKLQAMDPAPAVEVTPKLHQQTHFKMQVMRMGNTSITSGQAGEANNSRIKSGFRRGRTNQQKDSVVSTLVRLYRHNSASARAQSPVGGPKTKTVNYETSQVIALRTDRCSFSKHRNVDSHDVFTTTDVYNWICYHVGSAATPRELKTWDQTLDDTRRNLIQSPKKLPRTEATPRTSAHKKLEDLLGDTTVGQSLLDELFFFFCGQDSNSVRKGGLCLTLKVVRVATNPSVIHGDRDVSSLRLIQRIRANRSFMGRMWYDFVAISSGGQPHMGDVVWYARLLLLFHVRDSGTGEWVEMAFVRYMKRLERLADQENRIASSDDEPDVTELKYAQRTKKGKTQWYFGVIQAESILRKVHVIAGNAEASLSLRHSIGEKKWFEQEKKATFLMNNSIWETDLFCPYRYKPDTPVEAVPVT